MAFGFKWVLTKILKPVLPIILKEIEQEIVKIVKNTQKEKSK